MYIREIRQLFKEPPNHLRSDFKTKIEYDNYLKAKFFSLLIFAVSLLSLIIANKVNDTVQITDVNFVFFVLSSANALLFRIMQPSRHKLNISHKLFVYALIITVLGWRTLLMTSSLVAVSWIISRILYYKEIQNFTISRALRNQNANMQAEVLKQSLKLKNNEEEKIEEIIFSITKLLGIYDPYTNGHSENVATISQKISIELGLSNEDVKDAYWSGMVHDLGKLLVPIEILNKKGPLEKSEYETIKSHPSWGYEVLCQSESLSSIAKYVLHHHERWDGNGYPDGLKGDEIPLISQILAVADAWDAMTSERPYRRAMSEYQAMAEIQKYRGEQFSHKVTNAFVKMQNNSQKPSDSAS